MNPAMNFRSDPFQILDRTVFPSRNRVLGPAGETHIEPKAMDVLCTLAEKGGEVMSREALISAVWALRFGGDESLTRVISILRKALGPGAIETVSKRGYRLAEPIQPAREAVEPPRPALAALSHPAASWRLRRQGLAPHTMFPVAGLDFWRLPSAACALALALALSIGAADLLLA
jgi:DNA-binding winged helix-turn-helix (wHTH) protein